MGITEEGYVAKEGYVIPSFGGHSPVATAAREGCGEISAHSVNVNHGFF